MTKQETDNQKVHCKIITHSTDIWMAKVQVTGKQLETNEEKDADKCFLVILKVKRNHDGPFISTTKMHPL